MKQIMIKFSTLAITLLLGICAMSACGSAEMSANNKALSGTAQSGSAANDSPSI